MKVQRSSAISVWSRLGQRAGINCKRGQSGVAFEEALSKRDGQADRQEAVAVCEGSECDLGRAGVTAAEA